MHSSPVDTKGMQVQKRIDTTSKAVIQTCILTKGGSPNRFAVSIIRSLVRLAAFVKGKLRNILHHESRSTGFIRNEFGRN